MEFRFPSEPDVESELKQAIMDERSLHFSAWGTPEDGIIYVSPNAPQIEFLTEDPYPMGENLAFGGSGRVAPSEPGWKGPLHITWETGERREDGTFEGPSGLRLSTGVPHALSVHLREVIKSVLAG